MAKPHLIDTGSDKRYVRRDERGRFKESDPPDAGPLEGIPELVAATREQTAAIERQTAVIERLLTFLSPAAAGRDRQEAVPNGRA
jgi:hypothetical protein